MTQPAGRIKLLDGEDAGGGTRISTRRSSASSATGASRVLEVDRMPGRDESAVRVEVGDDVERDFGPVVASHIRVVEEAVGDALPRAGRGPGKRTAARGGRSQHVI